MQIEWQIAPCDEWQADGLVLFVFEKPHEYLPGLRGFLEGAGKWLAVSAALPDFQGKPSEVAVVYAPAGEARVQRIILAGLGPAEQFEIEKLKNAAAFALRKCREIGINRPGIPISAFEGFPCELSSCTTGSLLREGLTGAMAGLHRFSEMKTKNSDGPQSPESILLLCDADPGPVLRETAVLAQSEVAGIVLARNLTISPANRATPGFIAETASEIAAKFGFQIEIIDQDSARSLGMGAFDAVAKGSTEPAYVIVLEHVPPGTGNDPPIVFIGKGITFDTGGISLKARDKMEEMKQDMAGAASVLGAFEVIGRTGLVRRVAGILPCTENMPGGRAYKPGDVFRSYSGQTVEVISTDAEGRMVLCDALAYAASRFKPALMIDIATLTGASIIALGRDVAAVLGNREELVRSIQQIGASIGERFWPLPLWDSYFEGLKSDVADMKNVGDRSAGAIVGAMFLKQFVPKEIPWAHLDIAGTAWTDKDTGFSPKGATGFGMRTLFEIARRWPEL
ncbi:MAG: leucyl aminopeptidase family protein [Syntrophobacteraceae bacterium]